MHHPRRQAHGGAAQRSWSRGPPRSSSSQYMAANDLAAVITTSGQGGGTQEFTSNKRLLLRAVNKFIGQKLRSETEERLDEYQRQPAVPTGPSGSNITSVDDPRDMERGYDARVGARDARQHLRLGRQHPRPPQGDRVVQRGHRLRHLRLHTSARRRRSRRRCGTSSPRPRGPNVSIYSIDPRGLTIAGRRVDQGVRRLSRRSAAESRACSRSTTRCACRRTACAASRRRPAASRR